MSNIVLLIEDSPELLQLYQKLLSTMGCQIVTAPSGRQAIEFLSEKTPTLIIMDLTLGDMTTDEFYEKLSAVPGIESVPTILISGREDLSSWGDLLGARFTFKKPMDLSKFRGAVKGLLETAKASEV
jgi:DNA-binding response OmpR family regulator